MKVNSNAGAFNAIRTLLINKKNALKLFTKRRVDFGSDISVLIKDLMCNKTRDICG